MTCIYTCSYYSDIELCIILYLQLNYCVHIRIADRNHVLTQSFAFTDVDSRSCQNIAIEGLQPNLIGDTVFDVTIVVIPDSVYVLGDVTSVRLTVQGREGKVCTG